MFMWFFFFFVILEMKDNYLEHLLKLHIRIITLIPNFVHKGHLTWAHSFCVTALTILTVQLWGSSGQKRDGGVSYLDTKLAFVLDQLETACTPQIIPVLYNSPRSIFPQQCSALQPNPASRKEHPPGHCHLVPIWAQRLLALSQFLIPTPLQHISSN